MVDLTKLKELKAPKISDERTKIRTTIGLNIGVSLAIIAIFIATIISGMVLWEKIFVAFGVFCMIILQVSGIINSIKGLKAYNAAMTEYERLNTSQETTSYHG